MRAVVLVFAALLLVLAGCDPSQTPPGWEPEVAVPGARPEPPPLGQ